MITILLRILAILWILWGLKRILATLVGKRSKPKETKPDETARHDTVRDPVCGMYMDPRLAIRMERKDGDIFFCSEDCRRRYLSGPM